jgi:hypothetical protein
MEIHGHTDWGKENNIFKIVHALEEMATPDHLPVNITDREIYEHLGGQVPQKEIFEAIHLRIVFCADCNHVSGGNPKECDSCYDHRFAQSRFTIGRQ